MLKISLYQNFCGCSSVIGMNHNIYDYRKDQSYTTDRQTTSAIGRGLSPRQEPRIPYALPRNIAQILRPYVGTGRTPNGNDPHLRQFMGEAVRDRRYQRPGDTPRTRTQTHHGLFGRRGCTQGHRKRQTERDESERGVAAGIRQGGEREYLQGFLSTLARDIDV